MDTDLSSTLAGIRERWAGRKDYSLGFDPVDASRLLAALEAVLALADDWAVESAGLEGGHRGLADHGADSLRTAMYARSAALKDCALALREAITAELTGKEAGDEEAAT